MGQLYTPGQKEIVGPWLLDRKDLEELHDIFEFVDSKISECIDKDITKEAEEDFKKGYAKTREDAKDAIVKRAGKRHKRVTLISYDEQILFDSAILSLLKDPKLVGFKPKSLQLSIVDRWQVNDFKLNVSSRFDGQLDYSIKCSHQDEEDEIKYKVENWLDKNEPNRPTQWWNRYSFIVVLLGAMICAFSITQIVRTEKVNIQDKYRKEIKQLLDSGINQSNSEEALELLLKFTTEYKGEEQQATVSTSKTALRIFFSSILIVAIAIFKPRTTIGIGANKTLVKVYRVYTYFILVTIPGVFIFPPLIDWVIAVW
jgi:hypothetical protein